jgi:hypothetical protein
VQKGNIVENNISDHSGYMQCASLMLRRGYGINVSEEDPSVVMQCVKEAFGGDEQEFVKWADSYLSEGCGIAG